MSRRAGGHDNVSARKFLDAAQQTGDQMLFYTVFRSFQQRNQRLRGSPSFNPGERKHTELNVKQPTWNHHESDPATVFILWNMESSPVSLLSSAQLCSYRSHCNQLVLTWSETLVHCWKHFLLTDSLLINHNVSGENRKTDTSFNFWLLFQH